MPIGIVLLLVTSVAGLVLAYTLWRGKASSLLERRLVRLLQRTRITPAESASVLRQELQGNGALSHWLLTQFPGLRQLNLMLRQAGEHRSLARFCCYSLAGAGSGLALSRWFGWPWPVALALIVGLGGLPYWVLCRQRCKKMAEFDRQLPNALDLISRSLQIGMSLTAALSMVADEFPAPLGPLFSQLNDELIHGASYDVAFKHLSQRIPSEELRYFVTATLVQREVGGNLAELVANIARLIRQRLQLRGKIQVLTAEGRISAWLLTLLPLIMMALLSVVSHAYISVLWTDPTGKIMLYVMLSMMLIGNLVMRRMVQIQY